MLLKSTRTLGEMYPVLFDKNVEKDVKENSSTPIYWVFSNVSKYWENMTVISPGKFNGEFSKTFGHYHSSTSIERYKLLSGKGILLMQKRRFDDDDWVDNEIENVYFVELVPGDEIEISSEWGHSWSNIGDEPLITLDDWKDGHQKHDYEVIENMGGMSYFLVSKDKSANFIPNKKYKELPKPEWITCEDFKKINNF